MEGGRGLDLFKISNFTGTGNIFIKDIGEEDAIVFESTSIENIEYISDGYDMIFYDKADFEDNGVFDRAVRVENFLLNADYRIELIGDISGAYYSTDSII
ncbi:hypothetical protein ASF32_09230 [Methylobacterium sp. Leaf91]|nr:hypothetical protein ASF32_09230 [Methylobacterium sp. Leaf91]